MEIKINEIEIEEYTSVLDKLHKKILEIMIEIKRICDEYKIPYFLIGGSLLGAVRHKGFIPWDDDMDIGLLRQDYEHFVDVCKNCLSPKFQLVTTDISNYGLPYAKIQLKGTLFKEKGTPDYECGNGIFVDIFPIDKIPNSSLEREIHKVKCGFIRTAVLKKCQCPHLGESKNLFKRIIKDIYISTHTKKSLVNIMNKVAQRYNHRRTNYYYNIGSAYSYGKEVFPTESVEGDLDEIEFEGQIFKCPKHKETVLQLLYGDYMELPPKEKRYDRHGIIAIDFGD